MPKRRKETTSNHPNTKDKRNQKIRDMWEKRTYTKAEIGRRMGITTERVRQILKRIDTENPIMTDEIDWDKMRELRRLLRIPTQKSTHLLIETKQGVYSEPRSSLAAIEYYVYILNAVLEKVENVQSLIENIDEPDN